MSKKFKVTVGLLKGHINLRVYMFKLGLTKQQDYQLCGDIKEESTY